MDASFEAVLIQISVTQSRIAKAFQPAAHENSFFFSGFTRSGHSRGIGSVLGPCQETPGRCGARANDPWTEAASVAQERTVRRGKPHHGSVARPLSSPPTVVATTATMPPSSSSAPRGPFQLRGHFLLSADPFTFRREGDNVAEAKDPSVSLLLAQAEGTADPRDAAGAAILWSGGTLIGCRTKRAKLGVPDEVDQEAAGSDRSTGIACSDHVQSPFLPAWLQ